MPLIIDATDKGQLETTIERVKGYYGVGTAARPLKPARASDKAEDPMREQLSLVSDQSAGCWIKDSRRSPEFDEQKAKDALLAALEKSPPPCMRTVARKLGYDVRIFYKHFQELCYRVSLRYTKYINRRAQEDRARLREEVRQAVFNLYRSGVYPTQSRVSALLTLPSRIRRIDALTAFHQAKKELGLK